jgi:hypothetical protein
MQNGEAPGANARTFPQELLTAVSNPFLRNSLKRCHDAGNGDCDFFHNLCPNLMPPHPNCQPSFFRSTVVLTAPPAKTVPPPQVWGDLKGVFTFMARATRLPPNDTNVCQISPPQRTTANCRRFQRWRFQTIKPYALRVRTYGKPFPPALR